MLQCQHWLILWILFATTVGWNECVRDQKKKNKFARENKFLFSNWIVKLIFPIFFLFIQKEYKNLKLDSSMICAVYHFRTSLFIITSLVYAMLLIVVCVAYVISDVSTHQLPIMYYEGFFTYLYGASILFLLYVFCFLLQGKYF